MFFVHSDILPLVEFFMKDLNPRLYITREQKTPTKKNGCKGRNLGVVQPLKNNLRIVRTNTVPNHFDSFDR